jgi:hypothetical protein
MGTVIYDVLGITLSVFVGLTVLAGVVAMARCDRDSFKRHYLKWLCYMVIWCAASPFLYQWGAPHSISFTDAAFLTVREAGWTFSLMSYVGLLGLIIGGVVGLLSPEKGQGK